ncbi:MAG: hypothetical protein SV253_03010, partial [Halobacteria archaeon]|nr:hypothetical protein [Halobacteria archaeon]
MPEGTQRLVESDGNKARRPLTARDGVELREEVVTDDGDVSDWAGCRWAYQNWLEGYTEDAGALVFEDADGDRTTVEPNVRFAPEGAKREYSRLADLERGLRHRWGEFTTALLSLTSSSKNKRDGWRAPVDHLLEHTSSWDSVREALNRAVPDSREHVFARILEPHESGYAHTHVAVFVRGHVSRDLFRQPVEAHLRNCVGAGKEAHVDAVSVNRVTRRDRDEDYLNSDEEYINNLSAYLSSYMTDTFEEIEERPAHVQEFNALLWATETRRVSYSQNAYEYMELGRELRGDDENGEEKDLHLLGYTPD